MNKTKGLCKFCKKHPRARHQPLCHRCHFTICRMIGDKNYANYWKTAPAQPGYAEMFIRQTSAMLMAADARSYNLIKEGWPGDAVEIARAYIVKYSEQGSFRKAVEVSYVLTERDLFVSEYAAQVVLRMSRLFGHAYC